MKPLIDAGIKELQNFYRERYDYLKSAGAPPPAHIELKKPIPIPQPDWYLPDEALDSGMPGHTVEYFPDPPPAESGPFRYVSLPLPEGQSSSPPFQVNTSYSLPASQKRSHEIISIPSSSSSSSSDISLYSEIDSDSLILPVKRSKTISPEAEKAVEAAAAVVERESRVPVGPPIPIDDEYNRSFDYESQAASSMEPVRYLPPPPPPPAAAPAAQGLHHK